jgi:hypothetical protein
MAVGYRSLDAVVDERIARFRARRAAERPSDDAVRRVFAARRARIAAGTVGTVAGLTLFVGALESSAPRFVADRSAWTTYTLIGAWAALGVAGALAWGLARRRAGLELGREPVGSGDAHADLARIEAADPLGKLRTTTSMLEVGSTALPLAAASLLMPLTLHGLFALIACAATGTSLTATDFAGWITASAVLVGLAHLALVVQVVLWARSQRCRETTQLRQGIHATWARTLAVTAAVALVPAMGFAPMQPLALVPAVIVLATGSAFVPLLFLSTVGCLQRERAVLRP